MNKKRIHYLDNLRWITVWLVVLFHVINIFSSTGEVGHYKAPGIPQLDMIGYFVYPWFMALLFIISGICARQALSVRTDKEFVKERTKRLLIPFALYMLLFSVPTSAFSFTVLDGWSDFAAVPKPVLVVIMFCIGMGHAWFLLELYCISLIFIPLKNLINKLKIPFEKTGILALILFMIPLYFSAQVLNLLEVFRNIFYLLLFLLGYFVISEQSVQERLERYKYPLLIVALALYIPQGLQSMGHGFAVSAKSPLAVAYGYTMCLALIGIGKSFLNFKNKFTNYMLKRSFWVYLFHYLPMLIIAYLTVEYLHCPVWVRYPVVLVLTIIASLLISDVLYRISRLMKRKRADHNVSAKI